MNILFVCTGNTCRSPMAEAILASKGLSSVETKSIGLFASIGAPRSRQADIVLTENGIEKPHAATPVNKEDLEWADYILTMTNQHKHILQNSYSIYSQKVYTLNEMANNAAHVDIVDPYGGSVETYRAAFTDIKETIDQLIIKLNLH